jgi:hypothetical protein
MPAFSVAISARGGAEQRHVVEPDRQHDAGGGLQHGWWRPTRRRGRPPPTRDVDGRVRRRRERHRGEHLEEGHPVRDRPSTSERYGAISSYTSVKRSFAQRGRRPR